jgi:hypothetical protein
MSTPRELEVSDYSQRCEKAVVEQTMLSRRGVEMKFITQWDSPNERDQRMFNSAVIFSPIGRITGHYFEEPHCGR